MTLARAVRSPVVLVPPLPLPSLLLLLLVVVADGSRARAYPREIKPGCRYEGRRYQEGTSVGTSEPCLRCRCSEGALRCRLRVCPRLPSSPPPPGCHVRPPAEDECCAELVCGEPRDVENMLRRAGVQTNAGAEDEKQHAHHPRTEGCLHDGVRYGSGSAMMGSRRCEYCYCISGARRCIRPKCLLPLPGCAPLYAPHSCCPVAYNCTHHHPSTMAPDLSGNGCRVGERSYVEGEMVRDIEWKAACDNCFCAMGAVRCVPLACAPPLQGCSPIVREGQCCPSTYNCSGSIEVKAAQNYASYAFVSKDYAKFRKETNFFPAIDQSPTGPSVEGRGHRVVEEQVSTGAIDLEEDSSAATYSTVWPTTMETNIMDNEILIGTMDYKSTLEVTTAVAPTNELSGNTEPAASESTPASTKAVADSTTDPCATCSTHTFTDRTTIATTMTTGNPFSTDGTTISSPEWTTMLPELTPDNGNDENEDTAGDGNKNASENEDRDGDGAAGTAANSQEGADIIEKNKATARPFAISTDAGLIPGVKSPENSTLAKRTETIGKRPVTSPSSTILMPDDILVMNVTVKTNVSVGHIQGVTINPIRSIPADVEAILNITHREKGEDYDYDYSEPTLPPSLPNVRIIPFVAADALVKGKDVPSTETGYSPGSVVAVSSELRPTDASGFYDIATQENRFSPPVETEGGFVPREPSYFDVPYRSTDLNLEIGAGVTVASAQIANPHRKTDDLSSRCHFESMEYQHGAILPSTALCVICMCYYGEVACSSEKCPPLKIGCRRLNSEERCCGKVVCVEADESPTVVLDRADATAPAQRQPTVSPDPFRDVIKTEPAPDLPSLIEDMIPYLVERGITTSRPTTSMAAMATASRAAAQGPTTSNQPQRSPSFDFMEQVPLIRPPYDYREETADSSYVSKYGVNREVPHSMNTVSLTYGPKNRAPNRKPESTEIGSPSRNATASTELNRTSDGPKSDARRDNIAGQKPAQENVSRHDDLNGSSSGEAGGRGTTKHDNRGESNDAPTESGKTTEDAEGDTIFSLDSVLELLFSANASTAGDLIQTTKTPDVSTIGGAREDERGALVVSSTRTEGLTGETTEAVEASSKVLDNEIPMPVGAVLKLAGCNIYGRMYRVGRIITELSSACLECRCTEIGVQCKQLEC